MTDINPNILKEEDISEDLATIKAQIDALEVEREGHAEKARLEMAEANTCEVNLRILRDKASVILGIKQPKIDRSEGKTPRGGERPEKAKDDAQPTENTP